MFDKVLIKSSVCCKRLFMLFNFSFVLEKYQTRRILIQNGSIRIYSSLMLIQNLYIDEDVSFLAEII